MCPVCRGVAYWACSFINSNPPGKFEKQNGCPGFYGQAYSAGVGFHVVMRVLRLNQDGAFLDSCWKKLEYCQPFSGFPGQRPDGCGKDAPDYLDCLDPI